MSYLVANGNAMNLRRPIRYTLSERDIDFKILSRLNLQKMIEIRPNRMKLCSWFTTRMQQKKFISLLYMVNTLNLFAQYFPCHQLLQFSHWIGKWTFNWYISSSNDKSLNIICSTIQCISIQLHRYFSN